MSLNNQHAARLRQMAEPFKLTAQRYALVAKNLDDNGLTGSAKEGAAEAGQAAMQCAALLAGAEALEKLPLAQEQAAKVWGLACERDELRLSRANALEAVEEAKAALKGIRRGAKEVALFADAYGYPDGINLQIHISFGTARKITAALARLESTGGKTS